MGVALGILGAGQGIYQIVSANKQKQKAENAIADFKYTDRSNAYESQQVSTLGADLIRESSEAATASSIDALQKAGSRALAAGAGTVVNANNTRAQEAAADLDRQQKEIDLRAAEQDMRNEQVVEERERAELGGYGELLNQARNDQNAGVSTLMETAMLASELKRGAQARGVSEGLDSLETVKIPTKPSVSKPYDSRSWMGRRFADVGGIFKNK